MSGAGVEAILLALHLPRGLYFLLLFILYLRLVLLTLLLAAATTMSWQLEGGATSVWCQCGVSESMSVLLTPMMVGLAWASPTVSLRPRCDMERTTLIHLVHRSPLNFLPQFPIQRLISRPLLLRRPLFLSSSSLPTTALRCVIHTSSRCPRAASSYFCWL
ncbi:unnamed protein product [Hydatigera taeniaeformis]|uniref:Uncharacterized protein n=1 Tax=Hydatigena taeniaeformis TaxID=6205 RepID=A0A0R3X0U6_HYDTA|nr:unnamed protein product [Hydatigera taeniaeformis]